MGLITEIKCGKCDKRYSPIRSRCPYCGARRGASGKNDADQNNMRVQLIIGIIFLLALIAVVVTLLITSSKNSDPVDTDSPGGSITMPSSDDLEAIDNPTPLPTPTPEETPPIETPPPSITSVQITYANTPKVDITESVGTELRMGVKINPEGIEDLVPVWTSSDPAVFDVVPTDTTGMTATITMLSRGDATLYVTAGGITAECIVRVRT